MTGKRDFKIEFKIFDEFGLVIAKEKELPLKSGLVQLKNIVAKKLNLK